MAMQLASMVHGSMRERDALQHSQHAAYFQQTQPRAYPVSTAAPSSYAAQPQHPDYHYQPPQQQQQRQHPQSPPSPPAEEQKPSLPSISHLLEFAGGDKAASETAAPSPQSQHRHSSSPQPRQPQHRAPGTMQQAPPSSTSTVANPLRMTLPPTPPMHSDVNHDGNQSPSAASNHSAASGAYYMASSLNNIEPHHQRQTVPTMAPVKRDVAPAQTMSPYSAPVYGQAPFATSSAAAPSTSFYSPEQQPYNGPGMYAQRPLPTAYQPTMPLPVPTPAPNSANPWQHHHYISTSSQSQFPQSQDRYICSTCNKAFSRPSSLRIHSHSHTGEKPYRCAQPGCGKAFSVRSNMKRHERGCHAANNAALTT